MTLEGIDNVQDFVEKLDRIEPPGQLISFLTDPLLQKYVALKPSPITLRRIDLWLATCLEEQYNAVKTGTADSSYLSEILEGLLKHAHYTKVGAQDHPLIQDADYMQTLPAIVQDFLKEFLPHWDGVQNADSILGLLSYIPMQPFQNAYAAFLQPAERALIESSSSSETYELILGLYTSLFRRWAVQTPVRPSRRPGPVLSHADQLAFSDLIAHVDQLSTSLLISLPSSDATLTSSILTFYEVISTSSIPDRVPIVLPPTYLIYLFAVASSTTELSRVAGIIASFKSAFDSHPRNLKDYYHADIVDSFNCSIRDIYHLIWISRALSVGQDKEGRSNALGMYCDPSLRDTLNTYLGEIDHKYAIQTSFGISYNTCLASLGAAAWRELEEAEIQRQGYDRRSIKWHEGPVSQRTLEVLKRNGGVGVDWEAYRVHVLKWMDARGCGGLKEFLFASSKATREKYPDEK